MGYLHIQNLYKDTSILMFKECYAMEKIHGTSTHITFKHDDKKLLFSSGGEKHERFIKLFNHDEMLDTFIKTFDYDVTIFGEAYGGKQQGMSHTYGKELKFIVFDVKVGDYWLSVPNAEDVAKKLNLEFVPYVLIPANIENINIERDAPSVQAVRNEITEPKPREGVVLRPLIELKGNNGDRIISKHKGEAFSETKTVREVDPAKLKILTQANDIAEEWVTAMRLDHVLDKLPGNIGMESIPIIIRAMVEDVYRESVGEIVQSKLVESAIGKKTVMMFKHRLNQALNS